MNNNYFGSKIFNSSGKRFKAFCLFKDPLLCKLKMFNMGYDCINEVNIFFLTILQFKENKEALLKRIKRRLDIHWIVFMKQK